MWAWLGDNGHPQRYEQATSDLLEAFYLQDGDAARARIDAHTRGGLNGGGKEA